MQDFYFVDNLHMDDVFIEAADPEPAEDKCSTPNCTGSMLKEGVMDDPISYHFVYTCNQCGATESE